MNIPADIDGAAAATPQTARSEWRAHWGVVVASMAGMMMAAMITYSIGAFIAPIESDLGWSRTRITAGMTLVTFVGAVFSPFVGMLIDKIGPRRIAIPGAILFLAAFTLLSLTPANPIVWWLLWLLVSVGALSYKPTTWTYAVNSLFAKGRGLALAVMFCGTAIASTTFPFLATTLIDEFGWRSAFRIQPLIVGIVVVPLLIIGFRSAREKGLRRAGSPAAGAKAPPLVDVRKSLLSRNFLKIAIGALLFTFAAIGLVVNLVPVLTSNGITREDAAAAAGIIGISSLIGRLSTGMLLDRLPGHLIGGFSVLLPVITCLCLLLAPGSLTMAMIAIAVMGLCVGAELDVIAYLTASHFGTARYGTIFGVISSVWSFASGMGPLAASYVFDVHGSYALALWGAIPMFLIASVSLFTLGPAPENVEGI